MYNTGLYNTGMYGIGPVRPLSEYSLITFNGLSLPSSMFILSNLPNIHSTEGIDMQTYDIAGYDGSGISRWKISSKEITISGFITATTAEELETNIRAIQSLVITNEKDFYYKTQDGILLYAKASCTSFNIDRRRQHITYIPCSFSLSILDPYMRAVSPQEVSYTNISIPLNIGIQNAYGTKRSQPIITYTINSETGLTSIVTTINSKTISISGIFNAGDNITINSQTKQVTVNGVSNYEYLGEFPELEIGTSTLTTSLNGTNNYDITITRYPSYV